MRRFVYNIQSTKKYTPLNVRHVLMNFGLSKVAETNWKSWPKNCCFNVFELHLYLLIHSHCISFFISPALCLSSILISVLVEALPVDIDALVYVCVWRSLSFCFFFEQNIIIKSWVHPGSLNTLSSLLLAPPVALCVCVLFVARVWMHMRVELGPLEFSLRWLWMAEPRPNSCLWA